VELIQCQSKPNGILITLGAGNFFMLSVPETSSERGLAQFVPWIEPVSLLFIPSGL
jgi:hypothetical protein